MSGKRVVGSIASFIRNDQIEIASPPQSAVALQAMDCQQVVFLLAKSMLVEACNRGVDNLRPIEFFQTRATRLRHARRLVFKQRLVGGNFARLRRTGLTLEYLEALPA